MKQRSPGDRNELRAPRRWFHRIRRCAVALAVLACVACTEAPVPDSPTPDHPDPDVFDRDVPGSGGAGNAAPADRFVFPVRGRSVSSIASNTRDPRSDGWYVKNDFGTWCDDCGGNHGYHPGEDWNLTCAKKGDTACDLGEPVYAVANGVVASVRDLGSGLLYGVVIRHELRARERVDVYVLPGTTVPASASEVTIVYSAYLHLQGVDVQVGQTVSLGQSLGTIGSANGPHLHFELRFTRNLAFPYYKPTAQALTDRGMLVPTTFIAAHVTAPDGGGGDTGGGGSGAPVCTPGATVCASGTLSTCNTGGTGTSSAPCESGRCSSASACAPREVCNGVDDDGDGVIDDNLDNCWRTVYRFRTAQGYAIEARCLGSSPSVPSTCPGYVYEREAFVIHAVSVPGTFEMRQCSKQTDHIVVDGASSDRTVLQNSGYDCSLVLGYAYPRGGAPAAATTPFPYTCSLYRFSYSTSGGGAHLFTSGGDSLTGMSCETPARASVQSNVACFGSTPSGC